MKVEQKIINRFQQLIETESELENTRKTGGGKSIYSPPYDFVSQELANQWGVSSLHILRNVFGAESDHYKEFNKLFPNFSKSRSYAAVKIGLGILRAAKDDYESGYLFETRTLIEAEVFDEFLEQAEELFKKNYYQAAAVIAGCVLEDGLRKLGQRKIPSFPTDKTIDPMNVELAKAGIYNALWQKKITALADLRNKAAHGKWTEFTEKDVEDMIRDVRRFMGDYFS